jgi:UDP-galactopyranose mutase
VDSKMNRYYPTRTDKDLEIFEKYMSKAEKIKGLYFAGRLANYKYYNMDKALIAARKTFNKILKDIN